MKDSKKKFINQTLSSLKSLTKKIMIKIGFLSIVLLFIFVGYTIYSKHKENSDNEKYAAAYKSLQESLNKNSNIQSHASIEDEELKRAKEDLKKAKEHMSTLGSILLFKKDVYVTHSEVLEEKFKYAKITMKNKADYWDYVDHTEMDFSLSEDGKKIFIDIPRITIDPENVYIDTNEEPEIIHHPEPSLITNTKESKTAVGEFLKRTIFNENAKGFVTVEDVFNLQEIYYKNARITAYNQITEQLMSDPNFVKDLEDISANVIKNIYSPSIDSYTVVNSTGKTVEVHCAIQREIVVRFKD